MKKPLIGILGIVSIMAVAFYGYQFYNKNNLSSNLTKSDSINDDKVTLRTGEKYSGEIMSRGEDVIVFKPVVVGNINPRFTFKYRDIKDIKLGRNKIEQEKNHPLLKGYYDVENFKDEIYSLYLKNDFSTLEDKITNFRKNKLRFESGQWKLDNFYIAITEKNDEQSINQLENTLLKLKKWQDDYPQSITPTVLLIATYVDLAWEYRGGSFSGGVSKDGWRKYTKYLKTAEDLIASADKQAMRAEPRFFVVSTSVSLGLGTMKKTLSPYLKHTTNYDPGYYAIHLRNAPFLLPRWRVGALSVERYADVVVKVTHDVENYARIADSIRSYTGIEGYNKLEFDWKRIQAGFEQISKKYPSNFYQLHAYAWMACYYNQYELVKTLTDKTGYLWNTQSKNVWGSFANYYECKTLANSDSAIKVNLHNEIRKGNQDPFIITVKSGIDLNQKNLDGDTPLHYALKSGFYRFALILISEGADIRIKDNNGLEAIHLAAKNGLDALVSLLIERGVPVNVPTDTYLKTPLHYAANYKQLSVMRSLLKHADINVNAKTTANVTALHYAVKLGSFNAVEILLSKTDIELNVANRRRMTPLDIALQYHYLDIEQVLKEKGAISNPKAVTKEKKRIADELFQKAYKANSKNDLVEAKRFYLKSIDFNPYAPGTYGNLAIINIFEGDFEACVDNSQKAIELDKNNAHAILSAGQCLFMLHKPKKEFLPYYKRYIELKPVGHRSKLLIQKYPELQQMDKP